MMMKNKRERKERWEPDPFAGLVMLGWNIYLKRYPIYPLEPVKSASLSWPSVSLITSYCLSGCDEPMCGDAVLLNISVIIMNAHLLYQLHFLESPLPIHFRFLTTRPVPLLPVKAKRFQNHDRLCPVLLILVVVADQLYYTVVINGYT